MDISEEFLSHAAECKRMAQSARDSADKATWDEMARRWRGYAERYRQTPLRKRSSGHSMRPTDYPWLQPWPGIRPRQR